MAAAGTATQQPVGPQRLSLVSSAASESVWTLAAAALLCGPER
jgi:hypothetical protein